MNKSTTICIELPQNRIAKIEKDYNYVIGNKKTSLTGQEKQVNVKL